MNTPGRQRDSFVRAPGKGLHAGVLLLVFLSTRPASAGDDGAPPSTAQGPSARAPQTLQGPGNGPRIAALVLLGGAAVSLGAGAYLAETGDRQAQTGNYSNRTAIGMGVVSAGFLTALLGVYLWANYPPQKDVQVGFNSSTVVLEGRF